MSRDVKFAALALVALTAQAAAAQSPGEAPTHPRAGTVAPLPPIGLPLPQIGLPLPALGLPRIETTPSPRQDSDQKLSAPHRRGYRNRLPAVVYFVPIYGWIEPSVPAPKLQRDKPATGRLKLDLGMAQGLQVYVDGFYVGTAADLDNELELEAGPHNIEVRGSAIEPLQFDVNIVGDRSITYRGSLRAADSTRASESSPPESAAPLPPAPMTYYIIPGCYLGNVPPKDAELPATCDPGRAITVKQ